MRATITSVLSLAALASAAAVAPRTDYGYWSIAVTSNSAANGWSERDIVASYHNSELNSTIDTTCSYTYTPTDNGPVETNTCDNDAFSYVYSALNITVTQTVPLWGEEVTVSGSAPTPSLTCGGGSGRVCTGDVQVDASTAIA